MNVLVIGRGKVGRALAEAARTANLNVQLSRGRKPLLPAPWKPTVYVLAVPDAAISAVSERIAPHLRPGAVVIHCSGNRGPEELGACADRGAFTACVHPMLSFASTRHPPPLEKSIWIARGHKRALIVARKLARASSARCVEGPSGQPAYHAAAALLANTSAALSYLFVELLSSLGLNRRNGELSAAAMLRSVAHNVERLGVPHALTGPVRRGDADTLRAHLDALRALDPELALEYRALSRLILRAASQAGLGSSAAARIEHVLATRPKVPKDRNLTNRGRPARPRPR